MAPETSLRRAWDFLAARQDPDGSWPDFVVSPTTQGREWTTGYVAALLAGDPKTQPGRRRALLERAWDFLEASRHPGGGWGFWRGSPVDADSSAWCIRALLAGGRFSTELAGDLEVLTRHERLGGCATYHRSVIDEFPPNSGYYQPSACVTATVALARHQAGLCVDAAAAWLLDDRLAEGGWRSYWWDGGVYPTAAVVALWRATGQPQLNEDERQAIQASLLRGQADEGSWRPRPDAPASTFDTALAMAALLDLGLDREHAAIARAARWLLDQQLDDGSWSAPAIMRVPDPQLPWVPARTTGVVVPSHRRVFVTATVMAALARVLDERHSPPWRARLELGPWAAEVDGVVARFDAAIAELAPPVRTLLRRTPAWHLRGAGLSHVLPFWLASELGEDPDTLLEPARALALGNRFGQVYCLLRDGVVDGDQGTEAAVLIALDHLFLAFVRCFHQLFEAESPFWADFERYWGEYLSALATEQLWPPTQHFGDAELRTLAHKFSPVKICAAAMAELSGRRERLPALERLIEDIQLGVQILDDLDDAIDDARQRRPTWPLAELRRAAGREVDPELVERWLWDFGCAAPLLDRAQHCFTEAGALAERLGLDALMRWCRSLAEGVVALRARHLGQAPAPLELLWLPSPAGALVHEPASLVLAAIELDEVQARPSDDELREAGFGRAQPPAPVPAASTVHTWVLGTSAASGHRCASCSCTAPVSLDPLPAPLPDAELAAMLEGELEPEPTPAPGPDARADPIALVILDPWPGVEALVERLRHRVGPARLRTTLVLTASAASSPALASTLTKLSDPAEGAATLQVHANALRWPAQLGAVEAALRQLAQRRPADLGVRVDLREYAGSPVIAVERLEAAGAELIEVEAATRELDALVDLFVTRLLAGRPLKMPGLVAGFRRILDRDRATLHCAAGHGAVALTRAGRRYPCHAFARHVATEHRGPGPSLPLWRQGVDHREPCQRCEVRYLCGGGCRAAHLDATGSAAVPEPRQCARIVAGFKAMLRRVPALDEPARQWLRAVDLAAAVGFELPVR